MKMLFSILINIKTHFPKKGFSLADLILNVIIPIMCNLAKWPVCVKAFSSVNIRCNFCFHTDHLSASESKLTTVCEVIS